MENVEIYQKVTFAHKMCVHFFYIKFYISVRSKILVRYGKENGKCWDVFTYLMLNTLLVSHMQRITEYKFREGTLFFL